MKNSTLSLLKRFYHASKRYNFHNGLSRSAVSPKSLEDFHLLYEQNYIFSKSAKGRTFYIPTEKGKKLVLEEGQSQLFPIEGYFMFYLDAAYQRPLMFTRDGRTRQAKAKTREAAFEFKKRAATKGMEVFFRLEIPRRRLQKRNPDKDIRNTRRLSSQGDSKAKLQEVINNLRLGRTNEEYLKIAARLGNREAVEIVGKQKKLNFNYTGSQTTAFDVLNKKDNLLLACDIAEHHVITNRPSWRLDGCENYPEAIAVARERAKGTPQDRLRLYHIRHKINMKMQTLYAEKLRSMHEPPESRNDKRKHTELHLLQGILFPEEHEHVHIKDGIRRLVKGGPASMASRRILWYSMYTKPGVKGDPEVDWQKERLMQYLLGKAQPDYLSLRKR